MNNNNKKKSRRPLRPGDMVKFVGYASSCKDRNTLYRFHSGWCEFIGGTNEQCEPIKIILEKENYYIHRRQVTHVKRKKKYVDSEVLVNTWNRISTDQQSASVIKDLLRELKQEGFEGF